MELGVYRRPVGAAMAFSTLLLLLSAEAKPVPSLAIAPPSACQHAFSPLNALAERVPHTVARLARNDLRDVAQGAAQAPDDAKLSVAVNILNSCGGAIVLPDLSVVTVDPLALGADRLVRVSKMASNSLIVQLSPFDPRQPTSLSDHTLHHYRTHADDQPQITVSYPVAGTTLPEHIPHQLYSRKALLSSVSAFTPLPPAPMPTAKAKQEPTALPRPTPHQTPLSAPGPMPPQSPLSTPGPTPRQTARTTPRPLPTPLRSLPPLPLGTTTIQTTVSRLVNASSGGSIALEHGPALFVGPQALQSNATVTLSYNPVHPVLAEAMNYVPTSGTLRITITSVDPSKPLADALTDGNGLNNQVIMVVFPHPPHEPPATYGLTIMGANYLDGQFWSQTESDVHSTSHGDAASFSAVILRGHQATFTIEQYVSPLPSF